MAVDTATEVLIILVAIIVVMVVILVLTIVMLIVRCNRSNAEDIHQTYSYTAQQKATPLYHKRHSKHERSSHLYSVPRFFPEPIETNDDNIQMYSTVDDYMHPISSPRISAISGTSVDIGNLRDVSAFVRNSPRAGLPRHLQLQRESATGRVDSMRSSFGVDLGGDYNKAWRIIGTGEQLNL